MSKKVRITLGDKVLEFVDRLANNRSRFINKIFWQKKRRIFMQELENAYKEQANDLECRKEISIWEVTSGDGLND